MKPSWLFETDLLDSSISPLIKEIKNQNIEVKTASDDFLNLFPQDACVIVKGSLQFAAEVQQQASWVPGVYNNERFYDCSNYYAHFDPYLLAQRYMFCRYDYIKDPDNRNHIFESYGLEDVIFLRPDKGNKIFTGQLISHEDFDKEISRLGFYDVPDDEVCVISEPRNIVDEWRFLVCDGKIVTGSQYRKDGKKEEIKNYPPAAYYLAVKAAEGVFQPDRLWMLDICRTKADNYYVLEIGCFSCAGLYACDPKIVVHEASRVALEDWSKNAKI